MNNDDMIGLKKQIPDAILNRIPRGSLLTLKGKKELIGVEIGVQWGVNSRWMLDNLNIQKLYLVDPYVPYPSVSGHICTDAPETRNIAHDYLSEYGSSIEWVEKDSTNAVLGIPDDLDFIYIDGDHREIVVIADIKNYIKKVKIGGLVAGHDYDQSQVKSLVSRIFADELKIGVNYDWWVIKKDYHNESHWVDNRLG